MKPSCETVLTATETGDSNPITTQFVLYASAQAIATGTIAGTVKVQFSNDAVAPTNWNDVPSATVSITGTAGSFAIAKFDCCYRWIMIDFVKSGGTGTLTVNVNTIGA